MDERWMKGLERRLRARIRKRLLPVAKPYATAKTRGERGKTREESEGDEQKRMRGERLDKSENPRGGRRKQSVTKDTRNTK